MHQQVKIPDVIIADVHDYQGFIADVFWKGPPYCGVDYRTVVAERYALYSKLDAQTPGRRTRFVHALEGAGLILAVAAGMPIYAPLVLVVFFGIPLAVLVAVLDLLHVVNQKAVTGWLNQTILAQWAATLYDQLFNKTFYGWFIFFGGSVAGWAIYWLGRRLSYARAETVLADDPRRPILLLRAFDDDAIILYEDWSQSRRSDSTSLEDAITGPAKLLGPVIAIGRPEEPIRYRGAARQYHSEAEWQQAVLAWMDRALLIVVIAGRTAGLSWELGELDNRGLLHKVVVFFPPEGEGKRHHRWSALWQSLTSVSRAAITQAGSVRGMVALHFRPSGSMVVLRSRRRARSGHYTAALNLAIYGCLCHDWKEANGPSGVAGDPADRDAYISSGNTHIAMREYQRAIADYTKAIELNPDEADAYCSRGIAYSHEQDFDRTIADQTKAIEINPRSARAYSNRGFAHFSKGESDRSIADCTKAIEIDPRYPDGYIIRSAAYFRTREYDRALQDCTTALELDPNSAMAFFNRAAAWEKKGDAAHAIADYRRALAIDPSDTRAQAALARLGVRP